MASQPSSRVRTWPRPLLGYEADFAATPFGLRPRSPGAGPAKRRIATHRGQAHVLNVGQTGSGKTIQMIANALTYAGSMIILDVGGDIARCTHRFRSRVLRQAVHVIDPWGITGLPGSTLDPLAAFALPGVEIESEAERIAATLTAKERLLTHDPFWSVQAASFIAGDIAHAARSTSPEKLTINQVLKWMYGDDIVYGHAVMLDTVVKKHTFEAETMAAFLQLPDGNGGSTRGGVLATAHAALSGLRSPAVRSCFGGEATAGRPAVSLGNLLNGTPTTIYLCVPIEHVASHGSVLRLWVETMLAPLVRRKVTVDPPTLVLVDEAANLGQMASLMTIATYCRNRSVKLWTVWQSLAQIRNTYGAEWSTLVNNASAVLVNAGNALGAREMAEVLNIPTRSLTELRPGRQFVAETGREPRVVRLPRYWRDPLFAGRFDPVPRFARAMDGGPSARGPGL